MSSLWSIQTMVKQYQAGFFFLRNCYNLTVLIDFFNLSLFNISILGHCSEKFFILSSWVSEMISYLTLVNAIDSFRLICWFCIWHSVALSCFIRHKLLNLFIYLALCLSSVSCICHMPVFFDNLLVDLFHLCLLNYFSELFIFFPSK